jgi:polyhydroxyalkanoate synthesis regulator protein
LEHWNVGTVNFELQEPRSGVWLFVLCFVHVLSLFYGDCSQHLFSAFCQFNMYFFVVDD